MVFNFSRRSEGNLVGVRPDLIRVCKEALRRSRYDFGIISGVRTPQQQQELVRSGKSWTENSLHLVQWDGYGHAIDFAVWDRGKVTFDVAKYRVVMQAFMTSAIALSIQIELGGLWESVVDAGHVQLNWRFYGGQAGEQSRELL